MKAQRSKPQVEDAAPTSVPQTEPSRIGYGHPEYQFVQAIMEMQKSIGEVNAAIATLTKTADSTKSKVDDIVAWKNKILGGVIVVGVVASVLTLIVTKFSDWISISNPANRAAVAVTAPPAPVEAPAPAPVKQQSAPVRKAPTQPRQTDSQQ